MKWDAVPGFWTTVGDATLKYHAWGDGYEGSRMLERGDGFTVWYDAARAGPHEMSAAAARTDAA